MKAKKLIAMLLALTLVLGLVISPAPVQAAGDAKSCIADLIAYYKSYQESAETDIMRSLEEMAQVDAGQAEAWTKIMDYWSYINTEMVVNIGTVPEGLPEDNSVAIVILGFALNADGTMKEELIGRLQTGLAIAEAYSDYSRDVTAKAKVVGRGDINNIHIIEMQVFGTEGNNIALGKPVRSSGSDQSVSSSAGAVEGKINDGDRTTYWMRTDNRYYHYDLYVSTDGENFEKIGSKDWNTPETVMGETFDLRGKDVYATHVKLVGLYDSANSSFHLNELRVYGSKVVASGWSGYTTWELTGDGTLTFSPSGNTLENVTNIAEAAFYGCSNLTDVTLNENVTIGRFAFSKTGVKP